MSCRPGRAPAVALLGLGFCLVLAASACSDKFHTTRSDAQIGDRSGGTCQPGERRCEGPYWQECRSGIFEDLETCQPQQFCSATLGCVACEPGKTVCVGNDVHECQADGTAGALVQSCVAESCTGGKCYSDCDPASRLIYLVDDRNQLLSFNPAGGQYELKRIADLKCPGGFPWVGSNFDPPASPYSMSVDRQARAWVLYNSGRVFMVDTKTGACTDSGFPPGEQGFKLFGMGFATEGAGSSSERLFLAGGDIEHVKARLASLNPSTLALTEVGNIPPAEQAPELTGTGNGGLFAYFPGSKNSLVAELDPATAQYKKTYPLPPLGNDASAWAFAHWGGKFYIFVTTSSLGFDNSNVLRLDPASGQTDTVLKNIDYKVVGAGVSTCAPTVD